MGDMRFKTQVFQCARYLMSNTTTVLTSFLPTITQASVAGPQPGGTIFSCRFRQALSLVKKHKIPKRLRALCLSTSLILLFNLWCFGSQLVQFATVVKTEYVSAGVGGMRNVGSGTITFSCTDGSTHCIPEGSTIKFAYLYWHGPTNSTDPNVN